MLDYERAWRQNNPDKVKARYANWANKNPARRLFSSAKKRAKANRLAFDIEITDVEVPEFCPVFGVRLETKNGKRGSNHITLDKVIPSLGYVKGNVRVISCRANMLKSSATLLESQQIVSYIETHLKRGA